MTRRVSELGGADLALWVARATRQEGAEIAHGHCRIGVEGTCERQDFAPHEDWSQGGPMLSHLPKIRIQQHDTGFAVQTFPVKDCLIPLYGYGETMLIAAMRALVASVYGDTVPDEGKL